MTDTDRVGGKSSLGREVVATPSAMESARILDFARRWYPYGGGQAEDIFVEFGVSEYVYFERLDRIVAAAEPGCVNPPLVEAIRAVCSARLNAATRVTVPRTLESDPSPRAPR